MFGSVGLVAARKGIKAAKPEADLTRAMSCLVFKPGQTWLFERENQTDGGHFFKKN